MTTNVYPTLNRVEVVGVPGGDGGRDRVGLLTEGFPVWSDDEKIVMN